MNLILILFLVALDQWTKVWALKALSKIGSIPVIKNVFHLTYVENRGAAFGVLQNRRFFFIILTGAVLAYIVYFLYTNRGISAYVKISLNLIVAGAVGNLIDRIRLGFVVDFFDFRIWPVFNIADICVVVGGVMLAYIMIFKYDMISGDQEV